MLLAETKISANLRLTKSDTDGIFLHFDDGEKQAGIRLDAESLVGSAIFVSWAEKQLENSKDKKLGNKPILLSELVNASKSILESQGDMIVQFQTDGKPIGDVITDIEFNFIVPEKYEDGWRCNLRTWPY